MALRGHRGESENISVNGEEPPTNDGNFRALLRYRLRGGDQQLKEHVMTSKAKATYLSAQILIAVAGDLVRDVVANIKS